MTSRYPSFYLQLHNTVERPTSWRGRRYWLVSRALCGFRLFRLPPTGRADLKRFAVMKAREWAPYAEVGFHVHMTQDTARIWVWDATRVREGMLASGVRPGRVAVLPEAALQVRAADGLRLTTCLEGFEGQLWVEGELQASRWWTETPTREQWLDFRRASGIVVEGLTDAPPAEEPAWQSRPWTNSGTGAGIEHRGREAVLAGAGALLLAYGYFCGSLAHSALSLSAVEERLQAEERRSAPTVAERIRAMANLDFLHNFERLNPYPSQLTTFARVAEKLPGNGSRITAWSYQDGELQFTIASPVPPDIPFYVKTYSSVEGFTDVTADRVDGDRGLRIKLRLSKP